MKMAKSIGTFIWLRLFSRFLNKIRFRDIKAGNILLDSEGHVVIADFGVSGWMMEGGDRRKNRQVQIALFHENTSSKLLYRHLLGLRVGWHLKSWSKFEDTTTKPIFGHLESPLWNSLKDTLRTRVSSR